MPRRGGAARGAIDWAEVRRRVEASVLTPDAAANPAAVRAVLEERARALARPPDGGVAGERLEVVRFVLANERYAMPSRYVFEVFRLRELVPLPGARAPTYGLTAWRGDLLTIVDLRPVLGLPVGALNDLSRVIVVGADHPAFGILADAVLDLVSIDAADVREPTDGAAAERDYVRGMTSEAVLVLDGERILRLLHAEGRE